MNFERFNLPPSIETFSRTIAASVLIASSLNTIAGEAHAEEKPQTVSMEAFESAKEQAKQDCDNVGRFLKNPDTNSHMIYSSNAQLIEGVSHGQRLTPNHEVTEYVQVQESLQHELSKPIVFESAGLTYVESVGKKNGFPIKMIARGCRQMQAYALSPDVKLIERKQTLQSDGSGTSLNEAIMQAIQDLSAIAAQELPTSRHDLTQSSDINEQPVSLKYDLSVREVFFTGFEVSHISEKDGKYTVHIKGHAAEIKPTDKAKK